MLLLIRETDRKGEGSCCSSLCAFVSSFCAFVRNMQAGKQVTSLRAEVEACHAQRPSRPVVHAHTCCAVAPLPPFPLPLPSPLVFFASASSRPALPAHKWLVHNSGAAALLWCTSALRHAHKQKASTCSVEGTKRGPRGGGWERGTETGAGTSVAQTCTLAQRGSRDA